MILHNYKALLGGVAVSLVTAPCAIADLPIEVNVVNEEQRVTTPYYSEWPSLESAIVKDPQIEARIADILSRMTLGEKVGQMIMPEYRQVTPAEAKQYKIGSVLNGGGGWPNEDKYATAQEWAKQADSYCLRWMKPMPAEGSEFHLCGQPMLFMGTTMSMERHCFPTISA